MERDKFERLSSMLRQVEANPKDLTPSESLESAPHSPELAQPDVGLVESMPGEAEIATESLDLLLQDRIGDIGSENQFALEAIVMPYYRPVIDITNGRMTTTQLSNKWQHLGIGENRSIIESTFGSIGCIEIPRHPTLPYAGTGFVVGRSSGGRGILMTNRHVAEIFSTGVGIQNLQFRPGQAVEIDFLREYNREDVSDTLTVEKVLMIHPYWDMALLQVVGLAEDREPLKLSTADPAIFQEREVVTIGYPGYDPTGGRTFQDIQNRIFRGVYYVKRLQPGILRKREEITSYERMVPAITHDCSTLGGSSGSAVLVLPDSPGDSIEVIGLHFAGAYLQANYAVPTYDLAIDNRIVDTGIEFSGTVPSVSDLYEPYWSRINSERFSGSAIPVSPGVSIQSPSPNRNNIMPNSGTATWTIPLEVSVKVGIPEFSPSNSATPIAPVAPYEGIIPGSRTKLSLEDLAPRFSLPLVTDTFNWRTALSLAVASKLAYERPEVVVPIAVRTWGLDDCEFIEIDDTQCFIAFHDSNALVAFRGTESLGDWLGNLNTLGTDRPYGRTHRGFYNGFAVVKQHLEQKLNASSPNSILLTGHSLGGALATIAAAEWQSNYPVTGIYTFGQPTVGKGAFPLFFDTHYANTFFRFVNDDDIVPRIPPSYQHVGKLFHFDAQGKLKSRTEAVVGETGGMGPEMMSAAEFDYFRAQLLTHKARQNVAVTNESLEAPALEGLIPSVSDHDLNEYILKIEAQIS